MKRVPLFLPQGTLRGAAAWELVAAANPRNLGNPSSSGPSTLDTKPTTFPLGAHSHLCVGTERDSCSTAAQAVLRNSRQEVERKAVFLQKMDGEREIQVGSKKSHFLSLS